MGALALGLFASLLIGTIFKALGMIPGLGFMATIGGYAQAMAGAAMAASIAYSMKAHPLVVFSAAAVGHAANALGGAGGPLAVLIITIVSVEIGMLVSKKTPIDLIVTPFVTVFTGGVLSLLLAPAIGRLVGYISVLISWSAVQAPLITGITVAVVIGLCLTLPVSSAAISASLVLTGSAVAEGGSAGLAIAGGAAVAGCCAQMIGFAVISFKDNGWSGAISQGIGTSKIQMPNVVKNPLILIPTTLTSAITGPIASCIFNMRMYGAAINSGMGNCAFLGPIGIILGWFDPENGYTGKVTATDWIGLALICYILPALLSYLFYLAMRKLKLIKDGDMRLP